MFFGKTKNGYIRTMGYRNVNELLKKYFLESPIVDKNGYPYFVNPISDGIPRVDPALLEETVEGLLSLGKFDCDVILAPEAMGIPLAVPISLKTRIPYSVIRKREYRLPGEISVQRGTGYSSGCLYINGLKKGDRVAIVDDVLSTGGTIKAIRAALEERGIELNELITVFDKTESPVTINGMEIRSLLRVGVKDGRPYVKED